MSLAAENVSCRAGNRFLLNEVSLTLAPGKIVAIIGANGAGKSTLLSVLAGCPTPDSGRVLLENKPLSDWSWTELARRRAMLTQSVTVAFDFTVIEVVRLGALPYRSEISEALVEDLLHQLMRQMSVDELSGRNYADLSGGESRRVQLARVLLQAVLATRLGNTSYLLLDEPLTALDLAHQFHLFEALRGLVESGAADKIGIAVVLHDLDMAFHCADWVVLLKSGRIFSQGAPGEVITSENIRSALNVDISLVPAADGKRHIIAEPVQDRQ